MRADWSVPSSGISITKNGGVPCANPMAANDLAYSRQRNESAMQGVGSILVAGRTGQLASALLVLAEQRRLPLTAVGRPELDISDAGSVDQNVKTLSPRAIVNAAAYTLVDKAEAEPEAAFQINCNGPANLAKAAARLNIPFIHVSTDYVFDGSKATPYEEDDSAAPLGVYGRSKREGEIAVLQSYPGAVILRTSWVYSPYGQNFVKTMLRLAKTHDRVRVVDDQHGAPTSARDLAQAILQIEELLAKDPEQAPRWHLSPHRCRGDDMVWLCIRHFCRLGKSRKASAQRLEAITTADYPTPARRPRNSRLDCSKAAHVFGIRLPPWQQALESCLDELAASEVGAHSC